MIFLHFNKPPFVVSSFPSGGLDFLFMVIFAKKVKYDGR